MRARARARGSSAGESKLAAGELDIDISTPQAGRAIFAGRNIDHSAQERLRPCFRITLQNQIEIGWRARVAPKAYLQDRHDWMPLAGGLGDLGGTWLGARPRL